MSGFGGFGGFGSNNNSTGTSGFGGFGNNANTNTGFGTTTNTGFGATNTSGGGLFGSGGGGGGGFGSSGGFGSTTTSAFGAAKPTGFGTTTTSGGGLFGSNTATAGSSGFGGFGSSAPTTSFGASNTGGGLFGGNNNTPSNSTTTSNAFGGAANTSSPFGATSTTSAFGAPAATALTQNVGECQGTGSVPFQAFVEKEPNSTSNQQNSFQSISFQQPYQKFSPEELRLADYNQGRRYGNASNQAGAFGATNFGGFGANNNNTSTGFGATNTNTSTGSGLFGGGNTSSPFGAAQPATTGFGANNTSSGGLFGAKPATGGLFGSQPAAQPSTGGLFGSTPSTGFGGTTNTGFGASNTNTGSSLFGNNTASKPAFSFGNNQPASTGSGFGASTGTTAFGGGGLFGNNTQQNTSTGFGAQPAASSTPFGGFGSNNQQTGTSSLFGNNQQKPATGGLFGTPAASTGTSLFGNTQSTPNANPFGSATNTQNSGGLFGSKPAATGTSLFGAANPQTNNTGGGLFGGFGNANQNQNQQQTSGTSLFGGLNSNNQQQKGLFGSTNSQPAGGSTLFGNTGNQQGTSLFGNSQQQQQQQQPQNSVFGGGNSIFNNSPQNQQTPQALTASINDNTAFGSSSLFAGLANTTQPNPGPLATPLSSSVRAPKSTALPMYKLNSASASRFSTPQKRGFGFSYSNYGTPNSASSTSSTPGTFGGSMLGAGTFGRTLSKSISTSSLRRSFSTEDSILAPGAFTASPNNRLFNSTGSVKKLTISRGIRGDLFSPPPAAPSQPPTSATNGTSILKKRVSFDSSVNGNGNGSGSSSPLKQVNTAAPSSEDLGLIRPRASLNGNKTNGTTAAPEMEQVSNSNNQLAIVREEEVSVPEPTTSQPKSSEDQEPGDYWMSPSKAQIEQMNREQRKKVTGFTVGRKGVGQVMFNVPVDLTSIDVDEIPGGLVQLAIRSATVYPVVAKKPPMGKGLNVPSTITLENSWPRKTKSHLTDKSRNHIKKHIEKLRKVPDTTFVNYDAEHGVWTFTVEHFTTYALPDEDDDETENEFGQSTLSIPPDSPTPKSRTPRSQDHDQSFASMSEVTQTESDPDDTFQFRKKKLLPGAFDDQEVYEEMEEDYDEQNQESFLDERSVGSESENGVEEPMDQDDLEQDDESVSIVDQEMAGSFPEADNTAELEDDSQNGDEDMGIMFDTPGAAMRARLRAAKNTGTPTKGQFAEASDWAATLQRTVSPRKQDRAHLKSLIDLHGDDPLPELEPTPVAKRVVSDGRGFATSIDLMNSLFGQTRSPVKAPKVPAKPRGFEWPYAKRPKSSDHDISEMKPEERSWHDCMKPSWGNDGTLVYAAPATAKPFGRSSRRSREKNGLLSIQKGAIVSENRDVRFAKFSNEASSDLLKKHKELAIIITSGDAPYATLPENFSFSNFFDDTNGRDAATIHEKLVWQLAGVLWDPIDVSEELQQVPSVHARLRKKKLCEFWEKLVDDATTKHIALARSHEEKAIASLSGHRIADACAHLITGGNYRLATLVALIGSKDSMRKDMREQLNDWQKSKMLSEFSQPIRAIYELLAGNVCVAEGAKGSPEDRVESFIISKRFGLDWRQAFGLRLWYSILSGESIEQAVESFTDDIVQDKETCRPNPWYVEQKVPTLWHDGDIKYREDLLWGLLKLATFDDADLEDVLRPENSQLSPMDSRLSWQLSQAITSCGSFSYSEDDVDKADRTTLSFASQLTNEGSWVDAVFVLLHLSSDQARARSIQDHLARHAGQIGSEDSQTFTTLANNLKIPTAWIWEAKALYKRSVEKNPTGEVECLLKAGSYNEAHRTFSKDVAPKTIIELDYTTLRTLLNGFAGKENAISEWYLGGEIYQDFLDVIACEKKGWAIDDLVLERLLSGLPAVVEESRHPAFLETVAIETMSSVVARAVIALGKKGEKNNLPKILRLPLTEDQYLKHTVELSLEYYKGVMATAR